MAEVETVLRRLIERTEYVPVDELRPWPGNPRRSDLGVIKASLQQLGQYRPVVARLDGTIVAGNHVWQAIRELGWERVEVSRIDVDDDTATRILLIDNRAADLGTYDLAGLAEILASLPTLDATGYTADDMAGLAAQLEVAGRTWTEPTVRPLPEHPVSHRGQRWQLGPHTLVCGDSTDPHSWPENAKAGLLLTDPPYGIDYTGGGTRVRIAGDRTGSEAAALVSDVLDVITPRLAAGALTYVFAATGPDGVLVQAELVRRGIMRQGLVWAKQQATLTRQDYQQQHEAIVEGEIPDHELVAYGWKAGAAHQRVVDRSHRTILAFDRPLDSEQHPTMKPVPLLQHLIAAHGLPVGTLVLEPFAGSGSTLIACHLEGMVCWAVEKEPAYCDVILDRWREGTGTEPVELLDVA